MLGHPFRYDALNHFQEIGAETIPVLKMLIIEGCMEFYVDHINLVSKHCGEFRCYRRGENGSPGNLGRLVMIQRLMIRKLIVLHPWSASTGVVKCSRVC